MLKNIKIISLGFLFIPALTFSQATVPLNNGMSSDYLGWNSATIDPLNFRVYNQNSFLIVPFVPLSSSIAAIGIASAPGALVVGTGTVGAFNSRLWIHGTDHEGNVRRGLFSDMLDPNETVSNATFGGRFVIQGNGQDQRATYSWIFQGFGTNDLKIAVLARLRKTKGAAVYATASGDPTTTNWAGWFDGDVWHAGSWLPISDQNLKSEIASIDNSLELISTLEPKKYEFRTEEFQSLNLPQGEHYGFIAQEIEAILPELVSTAKSATKYDEEGEIVHDPIEFKTLRYFDFIPIIVAALNEREQHLAQQTQTIEELENQIIELESQFTE